MRVSSEIYAFLEVRTMLPDPDQFNEMEIVVSIGSTLPPPPCYMHIYCDLPFRTFIFYKSRCLASAKKFQWICMDVYLQKFVNDCKYFATTTLFRLEMDLK